MRGGHQLTPTDTQLDGARLLANPSPRQHVQHRVDGEDQQQEHRVDAQVDGRMRQHHVEVAAAGEETVSLGGSDHRASHDQRVADKGGLSEVGETGIENREQK